MSKQTNEIEVKVTGEGQAKSKLGSLGNFIKSKLVLTFGDLTRIIGNSIKAIGDFVNAGLKLKKLETSFIIVPDEVEFNTDNGGLIMNVPRTITTQESGIVKVGVRIKISVNGSTIPLITESDFDNGTYYIMMNVGSAALPYEPYNVVDWYANNGHGYTSGAWD